MFVNQSSLKARLTAAGIHFGISLLIALLAALLVFGVWYPYPYREISGGRELFLIVIAVDVVMGPLLTLTVFNRKKPLKELRRDLAVIGVLQLAALSYGLWTVAIARPVHLVFEIDRFRVVHAVDIPSEEMHLAPPGLQRLPLMGPTLLSIRAFKTSQEGFEATMAAVEGASLGARPGLWQSYEQAKPEVLKRAHPVSELKARFPGRVADIDTALRSALGQQRPPDTIAYLPLVGRQTFWTVLLDARTAEVIAFVPIDPF
ncbi:MAG: TfpX/TfpZ family type IV pilin accessory protein [Polaromonas sp.]|uniref:TfpX/TfpZ family type IV pilin accessory protein n=1 Tax=Polaromonas sp. TaxID=1869339 RepID=UPI003263A7F3